MRLAALNYNIPQSYPIFQVEIEKLLVSSAKKCGFSGAGVLFCGLKENQKWFSRWWRGLNRFRSRAWFSYERLNGFTRLCAGQIAFSLRLMFSFACQKRTRKAPAISTRWIHEKGAARPFQTPKEWSKRKKASRCAKRFFLVSPTCCFAAGVTSLLTVTSSRDVKSSAKP